MSDSIITDSNQILILMKSIFSYFENIDNLEILTDEFNLRDIIYSIYKDRKYRFNKRQ